MNIKPLNISFKLYDAVDIKSVLIGHVQLATILANNVGGIYERSRTSEMRVGVEMNVHTPKAERSNRDYDTTCNTTFTCVQFYVYFIFLCVFLSAGRTRNSPDRTV